MRRFIKERPSPLDANELLEGFGMELEPLGFVGGVRQKRQILSCESDDETLNQCRHRTVWFAERTHLSASGAVANHLQCPLFGYTGYVPFPLFTREGYMSPEIHRLQRPSNSLFRLYY